MITQSTPAAYLVDLVWDAGAGTYQWVQPYTADADVLVLSILGDTNNPAVVTYGGVALTLSVSINDGDAGASRIYTLLSPPAGVNDLLVSNTSLRTYGGEARSLSGVDVGIAPTVATDSGYKTALSCSTVTVDGGIVIDAISVWDTFTAATAGAGQTDITPLAVSSANYKYAVSSKPATAASTTLSWALTGAANRVSQAAIAYSPVANAAPVIDTPEADIVEPAGTAWTRDISDNSSDADLDTITYSVSPALPTGITLNTTTGVITATTSTVAQVPTDYTFTHSDGTDSVDDIVSIHITGILSVGGDDEMDNNETDVLVTATGLPATVNTLTSIKVDSVTMDNPRWNSGQPLFDAPAGMANGTGLVVEIEYTE